MGLPQLVLASNSDLATEGPLLSREPLCDLGALWTVELPLLAGADLRANTSRSRVGERLLCIWKLPLGLNWLRRPLLTQTCRNCSAFLRASA